MIENSKNWNSLTYRESNRETTIDFEYSHIPLNKSNTYSKQNRIVYEHNLFHINIY